MDSDSLSLLPSGEKAIHISNKEEEDAPNSTTALLSFDTDSSSSSSSSEPSKGSRQTILFISLILTTCVALSAAVAFAFLFFSSPLSSESSSEVARPLKKLKHPVVLLISSDGFRFGYQFKTDTPNIHRLINNGTEAERGLIPVFPTLTFPNHYSIVTGLYPAYHGIINNYFLDPSTSDDFFTMHSHEPKWWLGEPLWETVVNHGLKAATCFWPGSEVIKGSWDCPANFCMHYDESVPFQDRVDTVLKYFDLPSSDIPVFMTLYFEDPDHQGHMVGPDDPEITEAVARIDKMIGRLIDGLEKGIFEDVNIIMLGDHGMVGTCDKKLIFLDDLAPWIEIPKEWVQSYTPLLAIRPPPEVSPKYVVTKMNQGLQTGTVANGKRLKVYLKEELPRRLHYWDSDRIPPVIGLIEEGFKVEQRKTKKQECGGAHGYDNAVFSMRTIFIAHGPRFARGRKVPSFENVEIYNLITKILGIQGALNNGTASFPDSVLCLAIEDIRMEDLLQAGKEGDSLERTCPVC